MRTYRVKYVRHIREVGFIDVQASSEEEAGEKADKVIEPGDDALTMCPDEYHLTGMERESIEEIDEGEL